MTYRVEIHGKAPSERRYIIHDAPASLVEDGPRKDRPGDWAWGGVDAEETRAHCAASTAPRSAWDAFDVECRRWASKARALGDALPSRRRTRCWGEIGDVPDIGRALSGRPDFWESRKRGKLAPSITLGIQAAASCGNTAEDFAQTATQAAACAWALAHAGYSVSILGLMIARSVDTRSPSGWGGDVWTIKDTRHPLDIGRILCMGLPGVLRGYAIGKGARWAKVWGKDVNDSNWGTARALDEDVTRDLGLDLWVGRSWTACSESGEAVAQVFNDAGFEVVS